MDILTLTMNPTIDISTQTDGVGPDQKLRCTTPRYDPGGGGINCSKAIDHLGGESLALFPAGDPTGGVLQTMLNEENIRYQTIPIQNSTRENLTVRDTSTDQQYRFVMPGPELSETEWKECLAVIESIEPAPQYLIASGSLPPGVPSDFYAQLVERAKTRDIKTVIDSKSDTLKPALQSGVTFIKPNIREFRTLFDGHDQDERQRKERARELLEQGNAEFIVLSLGQAGALLVTREKSERINAPIVDIQSKVGAGDSMVAAIVLALVRGQSVADAVRYGVAAGTAAVKTPGSELCRKDDTDALYKQMTT